MLPFGNRISAASAKCKTSDFRIIKRLLPVAAKFRFDLNFIPQVFVLADYCGGHVKLKLSCYCFCFFSNANLAWFQPLTSWTMFTNSKTCRTMCEEKEGFCKQRHPVIKGELAQIKWRSQISAKFGQGQVVSPETMWKLFCWKKSCTHTNSSLLSLLSSGANLTEITFICNFENYF